MEEEQVKEKVSVREEATKEAGQEEEEVEGMGK